MNIYRKFLLTLFTSYIVCGIGVLTTNDFTRVHYLWHVGLWGTLIFTIECMRRYETLPLVFALFLNVCLLIPFLETLVLAVRATH